MTFKIFFDRTLYMKQGLPDKVILASILSLVNGANVQVDYLNYWTS